MSIGPPKKAIYYIITEPRCAARVVTNLTLSQSHRCEQIFAFYEDGSTYIIKNRFGSYGISLEEYAAREVRNKKEKEALEKFKGTVFNITETFSALDDE